MEFLAAVSMLAAALGVAGLARAIARSDDATGRRAGDGFAAAGAFLATSLLAIAVSFVLRGWTEATQNERLLAGGPVVGLLLGASAIVLTRWEQQRRGKGYPVQSGSVFGEAVA